ncbi:MAG: histidine--tRNA ligase [Candidatus Micrarchaeota archaeon]|nr:histidine--tRNA ligase [Candidatus Micrarchaeota archaeon]
MSEIGFPRGVRDLLPNEAIFRNGLIGKIEEVYRRFGFTTIDTPMIEHMSVLGAKGGIGEEGELIMKLDGENLGLRYDQTVSLARYFAMHSDLPLPFRRYAIGKAWRNDEPQRLRYREFIQADVDVIGGRADAANAEVLAATAIIFDEVGMKYSIRISDRRLVESVFRKIGVPDALVPKVEHIIDKLLKIGRDNVFKMLVDAGLQEQIAEQVMELVGTKGSNDEIISYAENSAADPKSSAELKGTLELLKEYRINGDIVIDLSIMRGLDYYTSMVFEFMPEGDSHSIAAGGRYDNLIGVYAARSVPCVGCSIGVDTVATLMDFSSSTEHTYARVFVMHIKDQNYRYALGVANKLREAGIPTDINTAARNISNQLSYANSLRIKYAAIVGPEEEKLGQVKIRDLVSGDERTLAVEDAIKLIKG